MPTYRGITYSHWRYFHDGELQWAPTKKHIENLIDLADRLRQTPPPRFEMSLFAAVDDKDQAPLAIAQYVGATSPYDFFKVGEAGLEVASECGTAACAVGTAAFFGIGVPRKRVFEDMNWESYSDHAFGANSDSELWCYLFDGEWSRHDNTAEGAAARILSVVNTAPKDFFREVTNALPEHETRHFDLQDHQQWQDFHTYRRLAVPVYARFKNMVIEPHPAQVTA